MCVSEEIKYMWNVPKLCVKFRQLIVCVIWIWLVLVGLRFAVYDAPRIYHKICTKARAIVRWHIKTAVYSVFWHNLKYLKKNGYTHARRYCVYFMRAFYVRQEKSLFLHKLCLPNVLSIIWRILFIVRVSAMLLHR